MKAGTVAYIVAAPSCVRLLTSKLTDSIFHKVKPEVVEAIKSAKTPPPIIAYNPEEEKGDKKPGWTENIIDALLGVRDPEEFLNKKKKKKDKHKDKKSKSKAFNFYSGKPDVQNCYGWSRMMTSKDLDALHGSSIGMFMVNLTTVIKHAITLSLSSPC